MVPVRYNVLLTNLSLLITNNMSVKTKPTTITDKYIDTNYYNIFEWKESVIDDFSLCAV